MLFLFLLPLLASSVGCPNLYPDKQPIIVTGTVELCNSFYVSIYDNQNKRVIAVSEYLSSDRVGMIKRTDHFRYDPRVGKVPCPEQYKGTGYDKGHMTPAGDSSTDKEMEETFLMTNMTPQKPKLNEGEWGILENDIRKFYSHNRETKKTFSMHILNIAVYKDDKKMNGIPIPTGYWKIIYTEEGETFFYADNDDYAKVIKKEPVNIRGLLPNCS
jgi:endonuclease G, mitochondrial